MVQQAQSVERQSRIPHCNWDFKLVDAMRSKNGQLGYRRYAKMILLQDGTKKYEAMNDYDRDLEKRIATEYVSAVGELPLVSVEPGYNTTQMLKHNYRYWSELFSDRQVVCIKHLAAAISAIDDANIRRLFFCLLSGTLEFNNLFVQGRGNWCRKAHVRQPRPQTRTYAD